MAKLLIIHGVGTFNSDEVLKAVGTFVPSFDLKREDVSAFNWDERVNRIFGRHGSFDLGILSRMSEGSLRAANLGFSSKSSYAGIHYSTMIVSNVFMLLIQSIAILFLPLLFGTYFANSIRWVVAGIAVALLGNLICTVCASKAKRLAFQAVGRRIVLTCAWPVLYFSAFSIIGLVVVALVFLFFRFYGGFQDHFELLFQNDLLNSLFTRIIFLALQLLFVLLGAFIGLGIEKTFEPFLKIISDVVRYIGLPAYRDRLQRECADCLVSLSGDCEHLIIYAHSLGSVIAVDTILRFPESLGVAKRLDLITIGSPLKRLFCLPFPEIFASPVIIQAAVSGMLPEFRWINVYRPLDFIGAAIGDRTGAIIDKSSRQYLRNHVNYWGDPKVLSVIEGALAETSYHHVESHESVQNWPASLTLSEYGPRVRVLWLFRSQLAEIGIMCLLLSGAVWILKSSFDSTKQLWSCRSGFFSGELFLIIVSITGGIVIVFRMKHGWFKWIRPFVRSFYGVLPDDNPAGIPEPNERTIERVRTSWGRLLVVTGVIACIPLAGFLFICFADRTWTRFSEPLDIGRAEAMSLSDAGLLQVSDFHEFDEFVRRGDEKFAKTNERRLSNAEFVVGFITGSGNLVVERDGTSPRGPTCILSVDRAELVDITEPYCKDNIPADLASISESGRFTAVIAPARLVNGVTTYALLVWDTIQKRERNFGDLPAGQIQFGHDDCLYYSVEGKSVYRACNLASSDDVQPSIVQTGQGLISAFALDKAGNLLATIENDSDLWVYAAGRPVSHMRTGKDLCVQKCLVAFEPDGKIIAVFANGRVTFWNWRSYDYLHRFFSPTW